ncbi:NAD(P)-dependent oxidoreductase [Leptospira sp. GIMC2001]|uniref:NAD(P)-dependent oxidoreductase n=1 Tax=Leptospira sp. GIMC2001 TaxID=1513297 RepID=UPI0023493308|nr:NAD(P)-dependent oxidoreductase [Leptospira sp. GIMC2001]WCL49554.1 NAD(P)-dependent oxidoreductase [Leptospira sp. GIMC2001]
MSKTLSLFGVGVMGRGIIKNLLEKTDWNLRLYARSPEKISDIQSDRIFISSDPIAAVTNSDICIICLTDDDSIRGIVLNDLFISKAPEIICDVGTTSLDLTLEIYKVYKNVGKTFCDSPMTGSKLAAQDGKILYMLGGNDLIFNSLNEFYKATGRKVIRCGDAVGSGQKAKQALNMIQAGILQIYMEGMSLAKKSGIDEKVLYEVIDNSAAKSGISDFKIPMVMNKNYETHFALKNMYKDLMHSYKLALDVGANIPLSFSLNSIYSAGMKSGLGDKDFCSLAEINKQLNGLD